MNRPTNFKFSWILGVLFKPKQYFTQITSQTVTTWLVPLIILTLTSLMVVFITGWLHGKSASEITLPPDYEYLTPEQQIQYTQASQLRQGAIFRFVFPAFGSIFEVWIGWLLVSGIIHLFLTLFGGRVNSSVALNLVAWSGMPFAVRDLIRSVYMLITQKIITAPGISGLVDTNLGGFAVFLSGLLAMTDLYLFWNLFLLIVGVRSTSGLTFKKSMFCAFTTVLLVVLFQALVTYGVTNLSNLSIMRMFF